MERRALGLQLKKRGIGRSRDSQGRFQWHDIELKDEYKLSSKEAEEKRIEELEELIEKDETEIEEMSEELENMTDWDEI